MVNLIFDAPAEAGLFARVMQSATVDGERTQVEDMAVSDLPVTDTGKKVFPVFAAQSSLFTWLLFFRIVEGVEIAGDARVLPPIADSPEKSNVFLTVYDLSGNPLQGVKVAFALQSEPTTASGGVIHPSKREMETDATGLATFEAVRGVKYLIHSKAFPEKRFTADAPSIDLVERIG